MSKEVRILLVDDHTLFRDSLSRLLQTEPDFRIVGSCATASEAVPLIAAENPDIVLLDYDLGEEQGSVALDEIRSHGYKGRVLMVTAGMSDAATVRVLESGSEGIFLKHSSPAQLVEAIRRLVAGEPWLDPRAMRSLISGATHKSLEPRSQALTARERFVLQGVFEGLTNKEIAAQLQVSEGSVKAVMQQLFDKTGVRTRSQLVRIALEKRAEDWLAGDPGN
ncbi:MAG TPA: response regulator transcription factor [Bryobacteraceae bacterium]|nr:response regulator transcription factor [Bryobacteraceae bacterium]